MPIEEPLFPIQKRGPLALYFQLKEQLKKEILSSRWKEGDRLPSE